MRVENALDWRLLAVVAPTGVVVSFLTSRLGKGVRALFVGLAMAVASYAYLSLKP